MKEYGCILSAWRVLFDANGDGFVSCTEFMDAVRNVQYAPKQWEPGSCVSWRFEKCG